jgi:hypothetical protein
MLNAIYKNGVQQNSSAVYLINKMQLSLSMSDRLRILGVLNAKLLIKSLKTISQINQKLVMVIIEIY